MAGLPLTTLNLDFAAAKIEDIGVEKLAADIMVLPLTALSLNFRRRVQPQ